MYPNPMLLRNVSTNHGNGCDGSGRQNKKAFEHFIFSHLSLLVRA
jgi:hypothetical protein